MLFKKIITFYCENHIKHTNTHFGVKRKGFLILHHVIIQRGVSHLTLDNDTVSSDFATSCIVKTGL
jgi:hypothetical protein